MRKEIALSSPHPHPSFQEMARAYRPNLQKSCLFFAFNIVCLYNARLMTCESVFCRLCFECCYCNRYLLCTIVPLCLPNIMFSSSYFNGCVAKRPRRCRLPIRERSFKVTIVKTRSLLKRPVQVITYGV